MRKTYLAGLVAGTLAAIVLMLGARVAADAVATNGNPAAYITSAYYALVQAYKTSATGFQVTPVNATGTAIGTAASPLYVSPATSPLVQPVSDNGTSLTVDGTVAVSAASLTPPSITVGALSAPTVYACLANGTTAIALAAGAWHISGDVEGVWLCGNGADCSTGGEKFHPGVTRSLTLPAITAGFCRSASGAGKFSALPVTP